MSQQNDLAIGIDLGTTYCCCAVYKDGEVHVIPNDVGKNTTPSYVTLTTEQNFVGEVSKQLAHENPARTIFDVKRLIGRKFVDPKVQRDMTLWPFQVSPENLVPKIKIDSSTYFPEEISAKLLHYLKECAEDFLGQPIHKAVITVPARFNDGQRQATMDAALIAGLNVALINEPTAAAIAYNFQKKFSEQNIKKNCLIFDLGGGTLDVSILSMHGGRIEVRSVDGHSHLGGEDFDNAMTHHCIEQFRKKYGIDLNEKRRSGSDIERKRAIRGLRRLKAVCEEQKKYLSATTRVNVGLFAFYEGKDLTVPFDRDLFNRLNEQKFQRCMAIVERAVEASGMTKADISDVVLVGGSSRIPRVQEMLRDLFRGHNAVLKTQIDPDPEEAVAYGAAIKAYQDCTNSSSDNLANLRGINAENKENVIRQITISDVIPLAIGIRFSNHMIDDHNNDDDLILDDINQGTIVIPRNTRIPCSRVFQYKIPKHLTQNDCCIPFSVFEGQKKIGGGGATKMGGNEGVDNHFIGHFKIIDQSPSKPITQQDGQVIDVTLKVDADGILHVAAALVVNDDKEERRIDLVVDEDKGRLTGEDIEKLSSPSLVQEIQRRTGNRPNRSPNDRVSDLTARFILMALYGDSDQTKRRVDLERQRRQEKEAKEIEEQRKSQKIHAEEEESTTVNPHAQIQPIIVLEKDKPKSKRAKAIFDFEAREANEMSFQQGDLITNIVTDESGWWFGKCNEKEGYFPFNYVEQIT